MSAGNLNWIPSGETRRLPPAAYATNVLCGRHNSALSPLDQVGALFYGRLADCAVAALDRGRPVEPWLAVAGVDVERWILKFAAGAIAAGDARTLGGERFGGPIPQRWLDILWGEQTLLPAEGLHFVGRLNQVEPFRHGVGVDAVVIRNTLVGARLRIQGHMFFVDASRDATLPKSPEWMHRPSRLIFDPDGQPFGLSLLWPPGYSERMAVLFDVKPLPGRRLPDASEAKDGDR